MELHPQVATSKSRIKLKKRDELGKNGTISKRDNSLGTIVVFSLKAPSQ